MLKNLVKSIFIVLIIIAAGQILQGGNVFACTSFSASPGTSGAAGGTGLNGSTGGNGASDCLSPGGGGGGGGGGQTGGLGGSGAGGGVLIKNYSGAMTIGGTIDNRGGGSSATNGGTVKLFYTGNAPSTAGITSGRTYSAVATTQLSSTCVPSSASNNAAVGTFDWSSPTQSLDQDSLSSLAGPSGIINVSTHYLVATGCNFGIPSNSTITGIRVDYLRSDTDNGNGSKASDGALRLVVGGSIQSTNHTGVAWSLSDTWNTIGGVTDLWGSSLTPAQVNSSNFGVALSAIVECQNTWGCSLASIDSTHITVYYVPNSSPSAPTLSAPSSGATNVSITPTFQFKTTDADNDYLKYKIIIYNSDCSTNPQTYDQTSSQVGWTGQDQQANTAYTGNSVISSSTMANFSGISLAGNTTYCWKAAAIDPGGTNVYGAYSGTQTFTTVSGSSPSAPTLLAPTSGATSTSLSPLFQLKASDPDNDYLMYKIIIYNSDCATNPQTFDQTLNPTGWTGQDAGNGKGYTGNFSLANSTVATFGLANLSASTQYCWKATAIDPAGTNTFGSYSPTQLFTTGASNSGTVNITGGATVRGGAYVR